MLALVAEILRDARCRKRRAQPYATAGCRTSTRRRPRAFEAFGPESCSRKLRTSRPRSPMRAMTATSAAVALGHHPQQRALAHAAVHPAAPEASRSSMYATDVARMIEAPIIHVNGDDPEACVRVARLRVRVPPDVQQGRRDRPHLLPPGAVTTRATTRSSPTRRWSNPDRQEAFGAQAVHRVADRPRRHHAGRGGAGAPGLPGPAGEGVRRGPRGRVAPGSDPCPGRPGPVPGRGPRRPSPRRSSSGSPRSQVNIPPTHHGAPAS